MADTQFLRQNAIVKNASVGTSKPPLVETGALSQVQVKTTPGNPQVKPEQQEQRVEILPPRDAASAVRTGGLPMVNIRMTSQGPQLDDGQVDKPVIILPPKDGGRPVSAGGLPMVQVNMAPGGPQVQTVPNTQAAGPQIPAPAPIVSAPRIPARVASPGSSQPRGVYRVPAPTGPANPARAAMAAQAQTAPVAQAQVAPVALPAVPELSTEAMMLCRLLLDEYLVKQRQAEMTETSAEGIQIAATAIDTLDQMMVAVAIRAEAAARTAVAPPTIAVSQATPTVPTVAVPAHASPSAAAARGVPTTPAASWVQQRAMTAAGRAAMPYPMRNASLAPRRVARGEPLPPVIVNMNGERPEVQPPLQADPNTGTPVTEAPSTDGSTPG